MNPVYVDKLVRVGVWAWKRGGWQSGGVRVIPGPEPQSLYGLGLPTWYVQVRHNGRWRWAYSVGRQHGYVHAGAAKRGVGKWQRIVLLSGPPWELKK